MSCGCGCGCRPYYGNAVNPMQVVGLTNPCPGPFDNVTHLRTATLLSTACTYIMKGLGAAYDTQGHIYFFEPSETTADDGVNYIRPNIIDASQPGRFRLFM